MTNPLLTLESIRSGAFPSDAHAVGFLLGEIERLERANDTLHLNLQIAQRESSGEPEAALTSSTLDALIAEADKYILPVDVKVGAAATFRKGVKVGTMLRGLKSHAERQIAEAYAEKSGDGQ